MSQPPSALEDHLGYWLRVVSNAVSQEFRREVEATGVTVAEWVVLRKLTDLGPVAPARLAEAIGVTPGAVSRLNERLEAKGLVVLAADQHDRRKQVVALNPAAAGLVPRLAALADANDERFFAPLGARDRETLRALLARLVAAHGLAGAALD